MHITWVVLDRLIQRTPAGLTSILASYRYRALMPAHELGSRGVGVSVVGLVDGPDALAIALQRLAPADVVVFGKMYDAAELQSRLLVEVKRSGARIVVDVCDDYFIDDEKGRQRREMVMAAHAISAASPMLVERIRELTGRQAVLIRDPYEMDRGEPQWNPGARLRAVWFGQPRNLGGLGRSFETLRASGIPLDLVVVTNDAPVIRRWFESHVAAGSLPGAGMELRNWSVAATAQALRACDVVLLPVDFNMPFHRHKGSNRMVDALWAGRFVVTQPLQAYEEFREWAWVGDDIATGLRWALDHPAAVPARVTRAQEHIASRYSPRTIGEAWMEFLQGVQAGF